MKNLCCSLTLLLGLAVSGCAMKAIDSYRGFKVEPATEAKFRSDELTCEEEATRLGFDNGMAIPDQSIRAGAVSRCLEKRGWVK